MSSICSVWVIVIKRVSCVWKKIDKCDKISARMQRCLFLFPTLTKISLRIHDFANVWFKNRILKNKLSELKKMILRKIMKFPFKTCLFNEKNSFYLPAKFHKLSSSRNFTYRCKQSSWRDGFNPNRKYFSSDLWQQ